MSARSQWERAMTGDAALVRLAAAAVLVGTVAAQHPNPGFNKPSRMDIFSTLYPNWRFFAPTPAQHDYHFFYRTLDHGGESSKWKEVHVIAGRKPWQIAWFPGRRPEKAVFDICSELVSALDKGFEELVTLSAYRMLREYLRARVRRECAGTDVKGFQFCLTRATGYDESDDPEILFVSPYTPMDPTVRTRPRSRTVVASSARGTSKTGA